jgi:hypothetical protein
MISRRRLGRRGYIIPIFDAGTSAELAGIVHDVMQLLRAREGMAR